jgi:hypothetical protein
MSAKPGSKHLQDVQYWASVPYDTIVRWMAADACLDTRFHYACILWSWCGPDVIDTVVKKDEKGFIVKDHRGEPIPATLSDIRQLLGIPEGQRGNVARTAHSLAARNFLGFRDRVMYLIPKPAPFQKAPNGISTDTKAFTLHIADLVINTDTISAENDPDGAIKTEAVQFLQGLSTRWKNALNALRTDFRNEARQGLSERRILIDKRAEKPKAAAAAEYCQPSNTEHAGTPPSPAAVFEALKKYGHTDLPTAERLIQGCREHVADCTLAEILQMIDRKAKRITSSTKSPIGFLVSVVPESFQGWTRPAPEPEVDQLADKIEVWKEMAVDPAETPEAREYAVKKLAELGIEIPKGVGS